MYGVFTYVVTLSLSMLEREARERCSLFFFLSLFLFTLTHIHTRSSRLTRQTHTGTRRASRNGWRCTSFGPDYPCGGSPEGVNQRSFEQKLDFAMHDTRDPMNEADLLTDFNDGRYRQGGAPDTTSPIRHHRKGHSLTASTLSYSSGLRFEASGSCPKLTKLNLQQNKDEPLHASSEDFSSDSQRLQNVLQGLGSVTGLGDVRTVLFPRVSASATLSDPFEMPFASGGSHHFSCSDSRATTPILGTPGGMLLIEIIIFSFLPDSLDTHTHTHTHQHHLFFR